MIHIIFEQEDDEARLIGYTTVNYSSDDNEEIIKQVSESELNSLIPDGFDADNWKKVRMHYKLVDGEVVFDEDYEPDDEV